MVRRKYSDEELKKARPGMDQLRNVPRLPIYAILENIRSAYNVGSMLRTADALHMARVDICGYSAFPPHKMITKTALGAEHSVPWEKHALAIDRVDTLRRQGMQIAVLEQTTDAVDFWAAPIKFPICFVVGNEVTGVSDEVVAAADLCLEVPMMGVKQSLNVATAFGVVGFELARRWYAESERRSP